MMLHYLKTIKDGNISPLEILKYMNGGSYIGLPFKSTNDDNGVYTQEAFNTLIKNNYCYTKTWFKIKRDVSKPFTNFVSLLGMFDIKYFSLCDGLISHELLHQRLNKAIKICELIGI